MFRQEPVEIDQLTREQQECIRSGIYDIDFLRPQLTTLDEQLAYVRELVMEDAGTVLRERMLFKTSKSMFGVGHVAIRAGDIVTLLAVRSPIVLRARPVEKGGGFTFVGDAYVDGIMHGEFVKTKPSFEDF